MIFEIPVTYIIISLCLWLYALVNVNAALDQINNTIAKKEITNKTRANDFINYFIGIFFFVSLYLSEELTATNMTSLKYFIIFVVIHSILRILYGFRKYPNNIKTYSMWEIYVNMILYMSTVVWMCFLWLV